MKKSKKYLYISDPIFTMFLAQVKTNFLQIVSSFSPVSTGMSYFDQNCTKTRRLLFKTFEILNFHFYNWIAA